MAQSRGPRSPDTLERTLYFPRQVVTPPDLAQDREYLLHKMRRQNRLLHGWGIKLGLEPKTIVETEAQAWLKDGTLPQGIQPATFAQNWLRITPGYALTPMGDEIYLAQPVFLNTAEKLDGALVMVPSPCCTSLHPCKNDRPTGDFYLVVEARERELRPIRTASGRCGDDPEKFANSRLQDTVRFRLVDKLDAPYPDDLARLKGPRAEVDYVPLGKVSLAPNNPIHVTLDGRHLMAPAVQGAALPAHPSPEARLSKCLRPAGVQKVLSGPPSLGILDTIPATDLNYGPPHPRLDKFLNDRGITVAKLQLASLAPLLSDLDTSIGGKDRHLHQLLKTAKSQAYATCKLVEEFERAAT